MKKTFLTVPLFFLCCWFCVDAQAPDWAWARNSQSIPSVICEGYSIATDKSNNVYVTGYYKDTIIFGSYTLATAADAGCYLAKYDANGNAIWAKSSGGSAGNGCVAYNVSTDGFGNAYVTGYFYGTVSLGSFILVNGGSVDLFLAKYDSSGNVLWVESATGTSDASGYGVATDLAGSIYITGYFNSPTITFGSHTVTNAGSWDIFLAKYDSTGNVVWAKSIGGTSNDVGYSITTDDWANVYITGFYESASLTIGSYTLNNAGSNDVYLAKYDSSGNVLWAKSAGGADDDEGWYVAADASGNAYLTGWYSSPSITFGSYTLTNAGSTDAFLAQYDSSGNVRWAKNIGGTGIERGYCVAVDKSYKVYISGSFNSPSLTFDTITVQLPAVYNDPMYLAGYDSSGHALWVKVFGSGGDDQNAVVSSPSGCLYIGGDFEQVNPFIIGNDSLILSGAEDVFVAKLCNAGLTADFTASDSFLCAEGNTCINFFDQSYGNPTSWQWHFTGAVIDTSTQQNPTNICYSAAGTYPVSLIVSNSTGSDTLTVASMIIVGNPSLPPVVTVVGGDTLYSSHGSSYQWYFNGAVIAGATDSFYVEHQSGTYSVQVTDQYGCQSQSTGTVITAVADISGVGVAVYPNPFTDKLTASPQTSLQGRGAFEFSLFDVFGRLLLHRLFTNQTTINTEQLARGVYLYQIKDKNDVGAMGKAVKE